jgi:hypothetical protein
MRESREVSESLPWAQWEERVESGVAATSSMKYFSCSRPDDISPLLEVVPAHKDCNQH